MRNYFTALRLERADSSLVGVQQAISKLSPEELNDEGDLQSVLSNDEQRKHYRRAHLQYDAIAAVLANPTLVDEKRKFHDSHNWDKRIVEFEPEQHTIEIRQ